MSKSKLVKKLTMTLFTLVAIFGVGLTNVNAETTTVDVEDSSALINAMNEKTTNIVRLNKDIELSSEYDTIFYIYKSKTLDLNGHTITVPNYRRIQFWYYADADIKLINSSNSGSAKIIGNHTGIYDKDLLYGAITGNAEKVNFEIDGVDFEVKNNNYINIVYIEVVKYENLIIKNSNIIGNQFLFLRDTAKNVYLESIKLDNPTTSNTMRRYLSNDYNLTINDVIDANAVVEYYPSNGVKATAERTAALNSIDTYWGPITVEFANGFNVSNASLTGKYGETPETNITIKNVGENNLQIKNVTVSDTEKFEIIGGTQPTVSGGATNTDFKVKAKAGLEVGTYTATITVEDMDGKTYKATVTLEVEKKNLTVGISGLDSTWVYGNTKTPPTATGVDGLGSGDYKITYSKKDTSGNYVNIGNELPILVGEYKATVSITNQNYTASEASVNFEITQINTEVKITSNDDSFTYDGNEHSNNGYTVSFNSGVIGNILSTGDTVNAVVTGKVRDVSDTADGNNTIGDIRITNAEGVDVTDCYSNKVKVAGKLTVNPILTPIVVTTDSDTKVYDGTELTKNNYTYTDGVLLSGDMLEATITGSQKFVGSSNNTVSNVKVMRNGEDITSNYTMGTHVNGVLEVTSAEQPLAIADQYVKVNGSISKGNLEQEVTGNKGNISFSIKSGDALTYDAINDEYKAVKEGTVTMTVTAVTVDLNGDGTPEWKETSKDFKVHVVNKIDVNIGGLSNNETFTYDGNPKKPSGTISVNDGTVNVSDLEVLYKGTGSTSYNSATAPTNAGTYTVTYKVPDTNANYTGTFSVAFTIKKAQLDKVTIGKDTFEYTGSDITPTLNNVNSNIEVTGDTTAKNVSSNTITAKIKNISNYEWEDGSNGDLTINWSITQATPEYTVPTGLTGVKGETLNDVTLPDRFTWNDASIVLTAGTHTYKATYTPVDTTNYKTITDIDIEVVVKDKFDIKTSVDGGNGIITPSKTDVVEGTKVEITFTPDTGYMIDKVLVNTVETTVTGNKIELTVNEEKEVKVSYKKIPFTVTVKDVDGATITPNGAVAVSYGEDKEFTITANSGYKLVKVLVDGTDKTADMVGDTLKLTNITSDINLEVVVEKIVYEVTEGANQKYTITKNEEAKFRINADFILFDEGKVYVDNELVDPKNYTAASGSTIITLKKEFVDTLSVGEHTLKVLFNDVGEAITTFNVAKVTVSTDNPQTGDNIGFYIISGILSIVGLAGAGIFYRRKQTN